MNSTKVPKTIRIGSRGSRLALWQAERAREMVQQAFPRATIELVTIHTAGDKDQDHSLQELGGSGVFVKAIENALLTDEIDIAVHSAKDIPALDRDELVIAATPPRGVVNDVVVCREHLGFEDLPQGAVIGSSSPRRAAQIKRIGRTW